MKDSLQTCPKCGSDACYVAPINSTNNKYFCFGCGFETTDFMKQGELPRLYQKITLIYQFYASKSCQKVSRVNVK